MSSFDDTDPRDPTMLTPVQRLKRDILKAAVTLSDTEARFLVDAYYVMQDARIRADGQIRSIVRNPVDTGAIDPATGEPVRETEPHAVLEWLSEQNRTLETQVKNALSRYVKAHAVGEWLTSIYGIGPVISAGLLAHIDIVKAQTAGDIWRYSGLDPTVKWEKRNKRPWNAQLKVLCVLPTCRVTTKRGHIPIAEVKVGDHTLTHRGRWRRVTKVLINDHRGVLYGLRGANSGNQTAWLTGGHPVYAGAAECWRSGRTFRVKSTQPFGWHAVEAVAERWLLSRPVIVERIAAAQTFVLSGVPLANGLVAAAGRWPGVAHPLAHALPSNVPFSPGLMRLFGLFIAEGHISGNHIGWSFHKDEADLIRFVQQTLRSLFDLPSACVVNAASNSAQVISTSKLLADALRDLLGDNGASMRLPLEWLSLPDELLWPLWQGIMDGDGDHVGLVAGKRISLVNPMLARAVVDLGRRLGLSVSLHEEIDGACRIHVNRRPDLEVRAKTTLTTLYDGPVYNLEVDEDHSYLVEGYAVHNCWKAGESFVMFHNSEKCFYGRIWKRQKDLYQQRNETGDYAERSKEILATKNFSRDTDAYRAYSTGKFPPAHIHAMARRYAVKSFLADLQAVWHFIHFGRIAPYPWVIQHGGHAHFHLPHNIEVVPGLLQAYNDAEPPIQ